ncbi:MAG: TerC/Alx family metal homeostasis membrane protein [Candidatus Rokubacteria bacterium]|nr:TerC/Alx family metal homeostasis membrane protein [Candidatus Rokubacteria bacterium]
MTAVLWVVFGAVVVGLLALDLGVLRRGQREVTIREALMWSGAWIGLALAFNGLVWLWRGADAAVEFLTGYLIEKALSIDHLFVFLLIFSSFRVADRFQHTVLFWGILGAFAMRFALIALGLTLVQRFEWILYVFGAFLVLTGIRIALRHGPQAPTANNVVVRAVRRVFPMTRDQAGGRFVVRRAGRLHGTPLLIVLAIIETTDFVFAVDSIPAILAITQDPMIVYTSNVFAVLGLRSLYFAIAGILPFFHYLHYAFAGILVFAGTKMLVTQLVHVPAAAALGVVAGLLLAAMVASVMRPREQQIEALLEQGVETGAFATDEVQVVERVFEAGDRRAANLMTPRPDLVWLDPRDRPDAIARKIARTEGSTVLVARGSLDDIAGMVDVRDVAAASLTQGRVDLEALAQRPLVLPEYLGAFDVLDRLREERTGAALVVDEYGAVVGLITLRDVAETVLGDLRNGDGPRERAITRSADESWRIDGGVALDELVQALELEPPTAEERALYDTVGGLAMGRLRRIPAAGDRFTWRDLELEVLETRGRRLVALSARRKQDRSEAA